MYDENQGACVGIDTISGCASDTECESGDCRGFCCSQWLNDDNCGSCNESGWCAECVEGTTYDPVTSKCL